MSPHARPLRQYNVCVQVVLLLFWLRFSGMVVPRKDLALQVALLLAAQPSSARSLRRLWAASPHLSSMGEPHACLAVRCAALCLQDPPLTTVLHYCSSLHHQHRVCNLRCSAFFEAILTIDTASISSLRHPIIEVFSRPDIGPRAYPTQSGRNPALNHL